MIFLGLLLCTVFARAQSTGDTAVIDGVVVDELREPAWGAIVQIVNSDSVLIGQATDTNGSFRLYIPIKLLRNAHLKTDYLSYYTDVIPLDLRRKQSIIVKLKPGRAIYCPSSIVEYRVPLISPWGPTQRSFTSEEIEKMAH